MGEADGEGEGWGRGKGGEGKEGEGEVEGRRYTPEHPRLKISGYAYGQNWLSAITDLWNAAISFETVQDTDKPRVYNTPID